MRDDEAAQVAGMIAELWGVERGETWTAFYGAAIADLDFDDAIRAVRVLFGSEHFAPTPDQVIQEAHGVTDADGQKAFAACMTAIQGTGPIDAASRKAWEGTFGGLRVSDRPPSSRQIDLFVRLWRDEVLVRRVIASQVALGYVDRDEARELAGVWRRG